VERDTLALLAALYPDHVPELTRLYRDALGDPALVTLGRRFAELDCAPDDAAVDALAGELATVLRGRAAAASGSPQWRFDVMTEYLYGAFTPAQQRCAELIAKAGTA
jgi:hypothetical protein